METELYQTIAINKYIEENVNKKITVTQDEITKYYTGHPKDFEHAEEVKVSHILIRPAGDTQEQDSAAKLRAEELWARIQKGEDFTKLAKENSMDDSASDGGDVGFIEKDKAAPEFMDAFALSVGGTKIIKTSAGYHILKVTEKKKEGLYTLDEVKGQLSDFLKKDKIQTELTKLVNGLRNEAKIEFLIPAGQPMTP
jgi:parvulin-like peptidyl-prolyl isomerase